MRATLSVLVVLALVFATAWWLRRSAGAPAIGFLRIPKAGRTMSVVERLPLTPHHSLVLVSLGAERLLVAVHPAGISVINRAGADPVDMMRREEGMR